MRWKALLTVLAAVLFLAGCDSVPTDTGNAPLAELQSSASVNVLNFKTQPTLSAFIPCADNGNGETAVAIDPWIHVIIRQVADASGGTHYSGMGHPIGNWNYVGQTTGDVYIATGLTRWVENTETDWAPYTWTFVNSFKLIGPGSASDLRITQVEHYTWNANDVLTAEVSNVSVECK
jgi:hypothetical protein